MTDKIVTFAALKSFYDTGQDLLSVFGNLVLLVVSSDEPSSILKIKDALIKTVDFNIPIDVLHTIIKRLKRENLVNYTNIKDQDFSSIKLTSKGKDQEQKVRKSYENAQREKNAILKSLKDKKLPYSDEILFKELNIFIENSIEHAVSILEKDNKKNDFAYTQARQDIAIFFADSEQSDPESFQRLKTFLYGKIIADAFLHKRFDTNAKIEKLAIYLDTNIVFSLMEFHEDSYNNPVKEIISLVKESGATVKVFSFTADEIKNKLRGYLSEYGFYSSAIRVGSIYSTLKRKGVSKLEVMSLIESLEEKLNKLNIIIDYTYDLENLIKDKEESLSKLSLYKPTNPINSIRHDIAALLAVRKMRRNKVSYLWEKSESIFLSADHQLTSYDFIEFGHKESGTFPEIVFRSDMASLLWLKGQSGSDNVFLHNLFASHMREKIINTNLWNKFTDELKKRRESGALTQGDIEKIISLAETEVILREKGEVGIKEILNDDNIKHIKDISEQKDINIAENEKIIIEQSEQLMKLSKEITVSCKIFWNKTINILVCLFVFTVFCLFAYSTYKLGLSFVSNIIQCLFMFVFLFAAYSVTTKKEFKFLGFLIDYRNKVENKFIFKSIEKRKKKYKTLGILK